MEPTLESTYREHVTIHCPELFKYTVLIAHEDETTRGESIGTDVLVRSGSHHLVASAAHCIRHNPRVIRDDNFYERTDGRIGTSPPVRIIRKWLHSSLGIGFLEIGEALDQEMNEDQLVCDRVKDGYLHVVGFPRCRMEVDEQTRVKTLMKSVFASVATEQTDDYLRLDYPEYGYRVEDNRWVQERFIETPHGFSGGGCFGVTSDSGGLRVIGYKLMEIQSSWSSTGRWVNVVPIQHLVNGTKSQFGHEHT